MKADRLTRGFTLIELLVVISIISLLASVFLSSLNSARADAFDTSIISNLKNLQIIIEKHHADTGAYPNGEHTTITFNGSEFESLDWTSNLETIVGQELPIIEHSAADLGDLAHYQYRSSVGDNNQSYILGAFLTSDSMINKYNDGSFNSSSGMYILGTQHDYCVDMYGNGASGVARGGSQRCQGGN